MTIKLTKAKNFPSEIECSVTTRNKSKENPFGISFSQTKVTSQEELILNRIQLAKQLEIDTNMLKFQKQVHGNSIQIVDSNTPINESDAMITSSIGVALAISIADCAAVLIYDRENKVIAGIHSGWRGTKDNITGAVIEILKSRYSSKPQDLLCYVSPCASGNNYEVGEDVARYFPNSTKQISHEKYLFDNKLEISNQLISAGVRMQNIEVSEICTIADDNYHSFRRDRESSGRMAAVIMMRY